MAEHRTSNSGTPAAAGGFTLVEMMVALMIMTVGITSLLLSLGESMSVRTSSDARLIAAEAVEELVHQVTTTGVRRRADAETDLDVELAVPAEIAVPGYATMRLLPSLVETEDHRDPALLRIRAVWLERGEPVEQEFLRVLPRQLPLGVRVKRFRDEHQIKR